MSNSVERFVDPGLPEHVHRKADFDERAAKRAERQVAILFMLSVLSTVGTIYSYIWVKSSAKVYIPILQEQSVRDLGIGVGLGFALFFIGLAMIHWAKTLMDDTEVIAERHEFRSPDEDRADFVATVKERAGSAQLGRRSLIKKTMGLAMGLVSLSPLVLLRDLAPSLPKKELEKTDWKAGTYLVSDRAGISNNPGGARIKASDIEVGQAVHVLPELPAGEERKLEDIAKDAVLLVRIRPEEFNLSPERLDWTYEGIIAFSKICSHMGCAVALYEQQTKHLLCPCHQSTFDVTRAAKVIFGPAARPLPQLAIGVDSEGYLVAKQGFTEPVGPSFWERNSA